MGFGRLDWGNWLYGIGAGFIGGGSTAVTGAMALMVIDSKDFYLGGVKIWQVMGLMFVFSGVKDMMLFLAQQPLPKIITTVTTTETSVLPTRPPTTITKTVEEKTTGTKAVEDTPVPKDADPKA